MPFLLTLKSIARKLFHVLWSFEFGFVLLLCLVALGAMSTIVRDSEKADKVGGVDNRASRALQIGKQNDSRINELEAKVTEQQQAIENQPRIIEREVREIVRVEKPFSDSALRDRARRLRNEQRSAEKNR